MKTNLHRLHSTPMSERAPCCLDDSCSVHFLSEVEDACADVAQTRDDDLLVGDGRDEVGRAQHEGYTSKVVQSACHVTHVAAFVVEKSRDERFVVAV